MFRFNILISPSLLKSRVWDELAIMDGMQAAAGG